MSAGATGAREDAPPNLRLHLLGGVWIETAAGVRIAVSGRKGEAMLAYLGAATGGCVAREKLAGLLWGDSDQQHARQSLRQALCALGRTFCDLHFPVLRLEGQTVALDQASVWVDVLEFETLLDEASPSALARAVALYAGEFAAGLSVDGDGFDEWLAGERSRLHDRAMNALAQLLAHQQETGDLDAAIETAHRALRTDRYREDFHRQLILLYVGKGMRASALAQYRACRKILECELGVPPDEETEAVHRRLLVREDPRPAHYPPVPKAPAMHAAEPAPRWLGRAGRRSAPSFHLARRATVEPWLPAERLLTRSHLLAGVLAASRERLVHLRELARRAGERAAELNATVGLGLLCVLDGDFDGAQAHAAAAVDLAEDHGDDALLAACLQVVGLVHGWRGDVERALAELDKAAAIAEARGDPIRLYAVQAHRGQALALGRRAGESLASFQVAVEAAARHRVHRFLPLFKSWMAEASAEAGALDQALHGARDVLGLSAAANQPWAKSVALRAMARVLSHPDVCDYAAAERAIDAALAYQDAAGLRLERPRSLVVQGAIVRARGEALR